MEAKDNSRSLQSNKQPRLKWTKQLHDRFVIAVNQLGGAYKATPTEIVKVMGIKEITPNHIKSHLQKYRLSKEVYGAAYAKAAQHANQYNEQRVLGSHANETSRHILKNKGKSPQTEGQTNSYKDSEVKAPKTTKNLQAKDAETTKHRIYQPATSGQPPIYPLSSCLTLYEASKKNQETQTADAKAHHYAETSVNETERVQILHTAKTKSAWLLATKSNEDKGLLSWPSASIRDGIFVKKTMATQQSYHDRITVSTGLQGKQPASKETKVAKKHDPIDLNVSAQDLEPATQREGFYRLINPKRN